MAVSGSSEVVRAAAAFNEMQDRLRRYVDDRTSMVAAIAHDLRTPLTRLRFRIEAAPEEAQAKMTADIDQMEAMIAATLTFVRYAQADPQRTRLELSSLLESIVDDMAETGADVEVKKAEKVVIDADSLALRRLIPTNLIENAIKYGARAAAPCRCTIAWPRSTSRTTAPACRRLNRTGYSIPSTAANPRAIARPGASASASRWPARSPAPTAATWPCRTGRTAACAPRSPCRSERVEETWGPVFPPATRSNARF